MLNDTPKKPQHLIANAVLFQLTWFACVLGGNALAIISLCIFLGLHYSFFSKQKSEWLFLIKLTIIGIVLDQVFFTFGILDISQTQSYPIWLHCLWPIFGSTINHSLAWLEKRPILAAIFAGISAPTSYIAGAALSDIALGEPLWFIVGILCIIWAILFPCLFILNRFIFQQLHTQTSEA